MKTLTRMAIFVSLILPCGKVIADDATTYEVGGLYYQIDAEGSYVEGSPTCVKVVRDADHPPRLEWGLLSKRFVVNVHDALRHVVVVETAGVAHPFLF
jgi:hypothetical protein